MSSGRDPGLRMPGLRLAGDAGATTDQNFQRFAMRRSVASSTAYNTFDALYPWGVNAAGWTGWSVSGGSLDPINVLNAYPHLFPIGCTIKNLLVKNNVGAASTKFKLGIYSNLGNGVPYPNSRIWDGAEVVNLPTGITSWTPNLAVAAGTLLWLIMICDNFGAGINLSGIGPASTIGNALLGIQPALTTEPTYAWQQTKTYDSTIPATYPITAPTPLAASVTIPAVFIRFA